MLNMNRQEEPPTFDLAITSQDAAERIDSPARGSANPRAAGIGAAESAAAPRPDIHRGGSGIAVVAVDSDRGGCLDGSRGTVSAPGLAQGGRAPSYRDFGRRRPARLCPRVSRTRRRTSLARKTEPRRVYRKENRPARSRHRIFNRSPCDARFPAKEFWRRDPLDR